MYWRMAGFSPPSTIDAILDKEGFTLDDLFDEEDIIQECKSVNSRLINFLRGKEQMQQMLCYIVQKPPEGAESKRVFRFPFIASEIISCEIDIILKTLVEDEQLMALLFSFLKADGLYSTLLAGYFSKVVVCLLLRKTAATLHYFQMHEEILERLVNFIGLTPMKEILLRVVGAEDHIFAYHGEAFQWLTSTNLLEMLIDSLCLPGCPDVHQNSSEVLCAISQLIPSALATKLSSSRFLERIFHNALGSSESKSTLVCALSVCISLLDSRKKLLTVANIPESLNIASIEMLDSMLQGIGQLMKLLDVSSDNNSLQTTYGELKPPFGIHRLKIVEFIAAFVQNANDPAWEKLICLGVMQTVINLFFSYPFNNILHLHIEDIIKSCFESSNLMVIDHILKDCDIIGKLLAAERDPFVTASTKTTVTTAGKPPLRLGNLGHITRIANRVCHVASTNVHIQTLLQMNTEWSMWQSTVLQSRNATENVLHWACGHPSRIHDQTFDDDFPAIAKSLTEPLRYGIYENEDANGPIGKDFEDIAFNDEAAESIAPVLHGEATEDSQKSEDTMLNDEWFAFKDEESNDLSTFLLSSSLSLNRNEMTSIPIASVTDSISTSDDDDIVSIKDKSVLASHDFPNRSAIDPECADDPKEMVDLDEELSRELNRINISDNQSFYGCEQSTIGLQSLSDPLSKRPSESQYGEEPSHSDNTSEIGMEHADIITGFSSCSTDNGLDVEMDTGATNDTENKISSSMLQDVSEMDAKTKSEAENGTSSVQLGDEAEVGELQGRIRLPLFVEKVEFVGVEV